MYSKQNQSLIFFFQYTKIKNSTFCLDTPPYHLTLALSCSLAFLPQEK